MPSSLTRFHSRALAHLRPPTCVGLRYGRLGEHINAFLGAIFKESALAVASTSAFASHQHFQSLALLQQHARLCLNHVGAGILNLLSIAYAFRPRLRARLTLGGRTLPRKPWVYGGPGSYRAYRYSCLHSHLPELHRGLRHSFNVTATLPYQCKRANPLTFQSFGILLIANHFRRKNTR